MDKEMERSKCIRWNKNVPTHVYWPNDIESQSQTMRNQKWDEDWRSNNNQNIFGIFNIKINLN